MATGSDKRQRTRLITFRVTEEEYARYIERASRAGLAVGAFARAAGAPVTGNSVQVLSLGLYNAPSSARPLLVVPPQINIRFPVQTPP